MMDSKTKQHCLEIYKYCIEKTIGFKSWYHNHSTSVIRDISIEKKKIVKYYNIHLRAKDEVRQKAFRDIFVDSLKNNVQPDLRPWLDIDEERMDVCREMILFYYNHNKIENKETTQDIKDMFQFLEDTKRYELIIIV